MTKTYYWDGLVVSRKTYIKRLDEHIKGLEGQVEMLKRVRSGYDKK